MSRAQQFLNPFFGGGFTAHQKKILSYDPIAYWPLDDATGTGARCLVNGDQNGAYTGASLANAAGPDGVTKAPLFDGSTAYVNVLTATLQAAFSGTEGTLAAWAKVYNAATWTDAAFGMIANLWGDGNNFARFYKTSANNQLYWYYRAAGTATNWAKGSVSDTGWMHFALSWSDSANEAKAYHDGSQYSTTSAPGTWNAANLAVALIGATTAAPTDPFHGWIADVAVWTSAIGDAAIADLATV